MSFLAPKVKSLRPLVDASASHGAPVILNFGGGVDSTAMMIGLRDLRMRPDIVIFADVGSEWPETYEHIDRMRGWLADNGFPPLTVVSYQPVRVKYTTLEENCLTNDTLPSLAFGYKKCSLKFKAEPMDKHLKTLGLIQKAWAAGQKPVKLIGYDAGPKDSRRGVDKTECNHYAYEYPLRVWGWDREKCISVCEEELGVAPHKSSCTFCPSMKPAEVLELGEKHPDLLRRAIAMEDNARPHLTKIEGLWRRRRKKDDRPGSWREFAERHGLVEPLEV